MPHYFFEMRKKQKIVNDFLIFISIGIEMTIKK